MNIRFYYYITITYVFASDPNCVLMSPHLAHVIVVTQSKTETDGLISDLYTLCWFTAGWCGSSSSSSYSAHQTFFKPTNIFRQYSSFIQNQHYRNQQNSRRCIHLGSLNMKLYTFMTVIYCRQVYIINIVDVVCIELQVPLRIKCHLCKDFLVFLSICLNEFKSP